MSEPEGAPERRHLMAASDLVDADGYAAFCSCGRNSGECQDEEIALYHGRENQRSVESDG